MTNQIAITIGAIIFAVVIFLLGNVYIKNQAVDSCMKNSKIETIIKQGDQTQTVMQPNGGWYGTCLKDKGLK